MEIDVEKAVEFLLEGKTYREIAAHFKSSISQLHREFSKAEHSARVREALTISADEYSDKAERVLIEAEWDETQGDFSLKKAKELSQFYRWKAAKRDPKRYSEKMEIDHTSGGDPVSISPIQWVTTPKIGPDAGQ